MKRMDSVYMDRKRWATNLYHRLRYSMSTGCVYKVVGQAEKLFSRLGNIEIRSNTLSEMYNA